MRHEAQSKQQPLDMAAMQDPPPGSLGADGQDMRGQGRHPQAPISAGQASGVKEGGGSKGRCPPGQHVHLGLAPGHAAHQRGSQMEPVHSMTVPPLPVQQMPGVADVGEVPDLVGCAQGWIEEIANERFRDNSFACPPMSSLRTLGLLHP